MTATEPNGCTHCGQPKPHGWQYTPGTGLHQWTAPTSTQILTRMRARRAARRAARTLDTAECENCKHRCEPVELDPGPSGDMYCQDCLTTYAESAH